MQCVSPPDPVLHWWLQGAALTMRMGKVLESTGSHPLLLSHLVVTSGNSARCLLLRTEELFLMHGELKELAKVLLAIFLTQRQHLNP